MTGAVHQHGAPPFSVAVLHGGPGGAGECALLAAMLADMGQPVLEPWQTARSVEGQIVELRNQLCTHGTGPVTLIGWSWGAWLALLFAGRFPAQVAQLILIGTPPFHPGEAAGVKATRAARLTKAEREEMSRLWASARDRAGPLPVRLLHLMDKADSFQPLHATPAPVRFDPAIAETVWADAQKLRDTGALVAGLRLITCPVTALHGEDDPHPAVAVERTLGSSLRDFRMIRLDRCGHKPWIERHARSAFCQQLKQLLSLTQTGPDAPGV